MKRERHTRTSGGGFPRWPAGGFTLIETLVVMTIVLLLMSIMLPAASLARQKAKRAKALAESKELTRAWQAYWTTYGKYPDGVSEMNSAAVAILDGTDSGANPDQVRFMDFPQAAGERGFRDPWGNVYRVRLKVEANAAAVQEHYKQVFRARVYLNNWQRRMLE